MGLVKSMAKEMMKEIGNKSREFYEFVLPPVDMHLDDNKLTLLIDLPFFMFMIIRLYSVNPDKFLKYMILFFINFFINNVLTQQ